MRTLVQSVTIRAPLENVWATLADFGDVAAWAPYMRVSHLLGDRATGVGTRRAMQHELGFRFEERVTEWTEGEGFSFDVLKAPWPMTDVSESWRMLPDDDGVRVTTRVEYNMKLGPLGRLLDSALVQFIVQREMRSGVLGLKAHVEHRARAG
jgi:ligand-binding SRPBCC domain-containing protein